VEGLDKGCDPDAVIYPSLLSFWWTSIGSRARSTWLWTKTCSTFNSERIDLICPSEAEEDDESAVAVEASIFSRESNMTSFSIHNDEEDIQFAPPLLPLLLPLLPPPLLSLLLLLLLLPPLLPLPLLLSFRCKVSNTKWITAYTELSTEDEDKELSKSYVWKRSFRHITSTK
jgi:hypothetical protein